MNRFFGFMALAFAAGCSKVPSIDDGSVACIVSNRIDSQTEWRKGSCQEECVQAFIQCAVSAELTADAAIQIALLNNPKVQVVFEEIGMARADLVEAGLLANPMFELEVRYPHRKSLHTNIEYLIVSSLLDIFLIPLRSRLAATEFEQTKLRVANEILNLAFDIRETYYELIAEKNRVKYLEATVALTNISSEISSKQAAIGNSYTLEAELSQSRFLEAQLALALSQGEVISLSEKLNRLLGFPEWACLHLPDSIEEIGLGEFDLCTLESIALQERLDLQIARFEIVRISEMLGLKDWWTYTNFKGGLAGEREPDGANLIGPGFSGELPLFNYGQAARMRLFASLRQAQERLSELEIQVLSDVRRAYKMLMIYQKTLDGYQKSLLPMRRRILSSSEQLYNVMGLGIDQLLENKLQEATAQLDYAASLKKYLKTKVELDRALGGNLSLMLSQDQCTLGNF